MLPHPQLALKIVKTILKESIRLRGTLDGRFYFDSRKIATRIKALKDTRKINAILRKLYERKAINYDKNFKKYFIDKKSSEKLEKIIEKIKRTYVIKYHKPLEHLEPPINIIELKNGNGEIIAQAKREGIVKPVYNIEYTNRKFRIIFRQFRNSGFIIEENGEKILEVKRRKITAPLEGKFREISFKIRRVRGRELKIIETKNDEIIALMKSSGFEKAIFSFTPKLKEVSVPLAVALFAIKQLDVIV